jgi:hypothetical protein
VTFTHKRLRPNPEDSPRTPSADSLLVNRALVAAVENPTPGERTLNCINANKDFLIIHHSSIAKESREKGEKA